MAKAGRRKSGVRLTPKKMEILQFVRDFVRKNGYSPTLQELGDHLGVSKVTVFEHVEGLAKQKLLRRSTYKARSLELTSRVEFPDEAPSKLRLAGYIAAGSPIQAIESREVLDLEEVFTRRSGTYVLKVRGDSMIEDQICDGDYVVVERRENARNGETVVALLDDGEATLKRFYKLKDRVRLQPANSSMSPIYVSRVQIQGVVIGVLRKY
jgi:repressor LexA